jgi:FKBP-type peptidyl-prolyl cis-trans isomerase
MKIIKPLYIFILIFSLLGCSESKEEQAFRASLIDKALNDETSKTGKLFLQRNKLHEGISVTASGLQYQVLKSAVKENGVNASITDDVEVSYEGRLIGGEVFDSSYLRNKTFEFPVSSVISGWREALLMMQPGDHWRIFVPPHLAYGAKSPSAKIAANSTLIFDIELLAILDAPTKQPNEKE